jgi:adenosine deaminase
VTGCRDPRRDLRALPKAHLHLHFTGSMRPATVLELAARHGVRLPDLLADALRTGVPPRLSAADERGWFRFQRLYDIARSVLRTEDDVRRLVREAAEDDAAEGSAWLELQVDPSGYAARFHGITAFLELVLDAARAASGATGTQVAVVVAANRTRHPLDARVLARLAAQYAGRGVVGFGLSNDERRGRAEEFAPAFRIAARAGLASVPHGGELRGADSVRSAVDLLGATRVGHGVRGAEDPDLVARLADRQITLEVCPASNVALGVYAAVADVPLRTLTDAGVPLALGADDPLIFGSRLLAQYELARTVHGFTDEELAALARTSILGSRAPAATQRRLLAGVDGWLALPPGQSPAPSANPTRTGSGTRATP